MHSNQENRGKNSLGLMIGNSRLHWGFFIGETLDSTWDTDHLPESIVQQSGIFPFSIISQLKSIPYTELIVASVVPNQTAVWQNYPNVRLITLDQVPIQGMYPTLGIDRALALWGAGINLGFPILVIDAGTALTFTGADINQCLVGGAILPGFGLQLASLAEKTGQLPLLETDLMTSLPPRFALNTSLAIQSGIIYSLLAGIKDFIESWWSLFPKSNIAITGGDRILLKTHLQTQFPDISSHLIVEENLIFWGMSKINYPIL